MSIRSLQEKKTLNIKTKTAKTMEYHIKNGKEKIWKRHSIQTLVEGKLAYAAINKFQEKEY